MHTLSFSENQLMLDGKKIEGITSLEIEALGMYKEGKPRTCKVNLSLIAEMVESATKVEKVTDSEKSLTDSYLLFVKSFNDFLLCANKCLAEITSQFL